MSALSHSSHTAGQAVEGDLRTRLHTLIEHLEHVLPGQAPIRDFVHHNTLHGYQHLPFPEALAAARRLTGAMGYLPLAQFRALFRQGRITQEDLEAVIDEEGEDLDRGAGCGAKGSEPAIPGAGRSPGSTESGIEDTGSGPEGAGSGLDGAKFGHGAGAGPSMATGEGRREPLAPATRLFETAAGPVRRRDLYLVALLHPLETVTRGQLNWELEERGGRERFQADVPAAARARLLAASGLDEAATVADLWRACLERLDPAWYQLHPEELIDPTPEHIASLLGDLQAEEGEGGDAQFLIQRRIDRWARETLKTLLGRVGRDLTLGGLLRALTGCDLLDEIRPALVRQLANFLDQGLAAWHPTQRDHGFYACWRAAIPGDPSWRLLGLGAGGEALADLPAEPLEAIVAELGRLGLPEDLWPTYLERLALELPGWSGIWLWRHRHPGYRGWDQPVAMLDYLAVRLILERRQAQVLCATWGVPPNLEALRDYFRAHPAEFLVRWSLFTGPLPEYLASRAHRLAQGGERQEGRESAEAWRSLSRLVWAWRWSPAAQRLGRDLLQRAWPLFRLAQHLGLCGAALRALTPEQIEAIFAGLERLDEDTAGYLWLRAYENHYRDRIFNALLANAGRGRWPQRSRRPGAQLVFCMDDREEGLRRHLEEVDAEVETLGAAAHFGVPHWWWGLDDVSPSALCPVVMVPSHAVTEQARPGQEGRLAHHRRRRSWRLGLRDLLHQEIRRNLASSTLAIALAASGAALALAAKVLAPGRFGAWAAAWARGFDLTVATRLDPTLAAYQGEPSPANVQPGFVTADQAQRVGDLLRAMGLDQGFAPLVVIMGHGSHSDNNPHLAAYDCGACSGNHSGPNARLFATMANRPETRALLREAGLVIPADCWFLGAEHDTCSEAITWYDLDRLPPERQADFARLDASLGEATRRHAQERCRKFVSAPQRPTPDQALRHVRDRGLDFSQARPELGHATNACAFIGRRALTQGLFLDRRAFLISYDPNRDPEGALLEPLLLANGPVGAGINLEYYFSTVDNDRYGAGSKITHNVAGGFGVMDGASSDLRTGLPRQMIEIHEAMRLLVIVEARLEVLTAIYQRQPSLQELIGNGWLLLAAKDPAAPLIHRFDPARGWVPWTGPRAPLAHFPSSGDYFPGTLEPLDPVLIGD